MIPIPKMEYKYTCVYCGTDTNADHCPCCKEMDGLIPKEEADKMKEENN